MTAIVRVSSEKSYPILYCGLLLYLLVTTFSRVSATTVAEFTLSDQVAFSHACIRASVIEVTHLEGVTVRYSLAVLDDIYGTVSGDRVTLDLLSPVVGNPVLRRGSEYVLFINWDNKIERLIGLKLGTYVVSEEEVLSYEHQPIVAEPVIGQKVGLSGRRPPSDLRLRVQVGAQPLLYESLRRWILQIRNELRQSGYALLEVEDE